CMEILKRHEIEGAERATLLPGVDLLFRKAQERAIPIGIVTGNSREISLAVLRRLQIRHDVLLTRDDGPIKPDPWGVRHICENWNVPARQVVMIGDYQFDVLS